MDNNWSIFRNNRTRYSVLKYGGIHSPGATPSHSGAGVAPPIAYVPQTGAGGDIPEFAPR